MRAYKVAPPTFSHVWSHKKYMYVWLARLQYHGLPHSTLMHVHTYTMCRYVHVQYVRGWRANNGAGNATMRVEFSILDTFGTE